MMQIRRNPFSRQQGAVLVELALGTPILLVMMIATAEVTRLFIDHNTLTKAVRNGARYVAGNALQGTTGNVALSAALKAETRNLVVYGNTAGAGAPVLAGLTVADITVTDVGADNIRVGAVHTTSGILGPVLRNFSGGPDISLIHDLEATVTMRAL